MGFAHIHTQLTSFNSFCSLLDTLHYWMGYGRGVMIDGARFDRQWAQTHQITACCELGRYQTRLLRLLLSSTVELQCFTFFPRGVEYFSFSLW
jgi:hypothetical protein